MDPFGLQSNNIPDTDPGTWIDTPDPTIQEKMAKWMQEQMEQWRRSMRRTCTRVVNVVVQEVCDELGLSTVRLVFDVTEILGSSCPAPPIGPEIVITFADNPSCRIYGYPHATHTPGHVERCYEIGGRHICSGEYSEIWCNHGANNILPTPMSPNYQPDMMSLGHDRRIHLDEVRSRSQTDSELMRKMKEIMDRLEEERRGHREVHPPLPPLYPIPLPPG